MNGTHVVFLVDTGAMRGRDPAALAARLGLQRKAAVRSSTAGGSATRPRRPRRPHARGACAPSGCAMVALPELDGPLLGMDVLGRLRRQQRDGALRIDLGGPLGRRRRAPLGSGALETSAPASLRGQDGPARRGRRRTSATCSTSSGRPRAAHPEPAPPARRHAAAEPGVAPSRRSAATAWRRRPRATARRRRLRRRRSHPGRHARQPTTAFSGASPRTAAPLTSTAPSTRRG